MNHTGGILTTFTNKNVTRPRVLSILALSQSEHSEFC